MGCREHMQVVKACIGVQVGQLEQYRGIKIVNLWAYPIWMQVQQSPANQLLLLDGVQALRHPWHISYMLSIYSIYEFLEIGHLHTLYNGEPVVGVHYLTLLKTIE